MDTIYLLAISQGLLMLFFLFRRKNRNEANTLLSCWIISICLVLASSYFHSQGLMAQYPHLLGLDMATPFLCGPLLYLYIHLILHPGKRLSVHDYLHFLPFTTFLLYLTFSFYLQDGAFKIQVLNREVLIMPRPFQIAVYLMSIIQAFIYSLVAFYRIVKSENTNLQLKIWLKVFAGGVLLINTLFFGVFIGKIYPGVFWIPFKIEFFNLALFTMVYLMIVLALKFPGLFDYYRLLDQRYAKSNVQDTEIEKIWRDLLDLMDAERPYLKEGLVVSKLAENLDINAKTLSQVINTKSGGNFSRFLNQYRIKEFKSKIDQQQNLQFTIEALAKDCGFASKVAFHTAFRREESTTPAAYIRNQST